MLPRLSGEEENILAKERRLLLVTGALIALISVFLTQFGNPANMGLCVACFIRDIAGGLGLHRAETVQYLRPEIPGFVLGSMITAMATGEFRVRGGSSPIIRFVIGSFVMIGALVFLGCPLRMVLRLAAGDLNALIGLLGFACGIWIGSAWIRKGFSLGRNQKTLRTNGFVLPFIAIALLGFLFFKPQFIFFSTKGPGSMHAPFYLALSGGLIIGILAQRSRFCLAGGIRNLYLIRDTQLFVGLIAILIVATAANLVSATFSFGFVQQPVAHTSALWNFLGMLLVGYGSVLLGGCPLRQCILAGEGDADAAVTFLGMLIGAAFAHNFSLAASPAGVGPNGKLAVLAGIVLFSIIAYFSTPALMESRKQEAKTNVIQS
jgi:YedE family putative selenium metabolism protein